MVTYIFICLLGWLSKGVCVYVCMREKEKENVSVNECVCVRVTVSGVCV